MGQGDCRWAFLNKGKLVAISHVKAGRVVSATEWRAVSLDRQTVFTIDNGRIVDEEPIECHLDADSLPRVDGEFREWIATHRARNVSVSYSLPPEELECPPGNCPCGDRPRAGCVFHDPRLQ